MRVKGLRALLLIGAMVVAFVPAASRADEPMELCKNVWVQQLVSSSVWINFDTKMDAKYTWWRNWTPDHCVRII